MPIDLMDPSSEKASDLKKPPKKKAQAPVDLSDLSSALKESGLRSLGIEKNMTDEKTPASTPAVAEDPDLAILEAKTKKKITRVVLPFNKASSPKPKPEGDQAIKETPAKPATAEEVKSAFEKNQAEQTISHEQREKNEFSKKVALRAMENTITDTFFPKQADPKTFGQILNENLDDEIAPKDKKEKPLPTKKPKEEKLEVDSERIKRLDEMLSFLDEHIRSRSIEKLNIVGEQEKTNLLEKIRTAEYKRAVLGRVRDYFLNPEKNSLAKDEKIEAEEVRDDVRNKMSEEKTNISPQEVMKKRAFELGEVATYLENRKKLLLEQLAPVEQAGSGAELESVKNKIAGTTDRLEKVAAARSYLLDPSKYSKVITEDEWAEVKDIEMEVIERAERGEALVKPQNITSKTSITKPLDRTVRAPSPKNVSKAKEEARDLKETPVVIKNVDSVTPEVTAQVSEPEKPSTKPQPETPESEPTVSAENPEQNTEVDSKEMLALRKETSDLFRAKIDEVMKGVEKARAEYEKQLKLKTQHDHLQTKRGGFIAQLLRKALPRKENPNEAEYERTKSSYTEAIDALNQVLNDEAINDQLAKKAVAVAPAQGLKAITEEKGGLFIELKKIQVAEAKRLQDLKEGGLPEKERGAIKELLERYKKNEHKLALGVGAIIGNNPEENV